MVIRRAGFLLRGFGGGGGGGSRYHMLRGALILRRIRLMMEGEGGCGVEMGRRLGRRWCVQRLRGGWIDMLCEERRMTFFFFSYEGRFLSPPRLYFNESEAVVFVLGLQSLRAAHMFEETSSVDSGEPLLEILKGLWGRRECDNLQ